jgi:hypothetical protein
MIVAGVALVFSTTAFAEFYVAKDPTTNKCHISDKKPDGTTEIMVGAGSYATREEAKAARKTAADCPKRASKTE